MGRKKGCLRILKRVDSSKTMKRSVIDKWKPFISAPKLPLSTTDTLSLCLPDAYIHREVPQSEEPGPR